MRSLSYLVGLLSVVFPLVTVYAAARSGLSVVESLPTIPRGWIQGDAVPSSKRLRFRIAIKQQNAHAFEQHVLDISTPDHPKYGEHMTREELKAMLRPSADASESIVGWLASEGVPAKDIEDDGDWVNFYVPATEAERILDTKLVIFDCIERCVRVYADWCQILLLRKLHQRSHKNSYIALLCPRDGSSICSDDPAYHSIRPDAPRTIKRF